MVEACPACGKRLQPGEFKDHNCSSNKTQKAIEKPDLVKRFSDFNLRK